MSKYSDFHITVNPHVYPKTTEEARQWQQMLLTAVKELAEVIDEHLPIDDPDTLEEVRIEALSAEIGPERQTAHAHFVLNLRHKSKVHLNQINGRLQQYFNDALGIDGCYVRAKLLSSSAFKNYAQKNATQGGPTASDPRERTIQDREIVFSDTAGEAAGGSVHSQHIRY